MSTWEICESGAGGEEGFGEEPIGIVEDKGEGGQSGAGAEDTKGGNGENGKGEGDEQAVGEDGDGGDHIEVPKNKRCGADPRSEGDGEDIDGFLGDGGCVATGFTDQVRWEEWIGSGEFGERALEEWGENGNRCEDEERELETGHEQLLGVVEEDDESGGAEAVEDSWLAIKSEATEKDGSHDGGADCRGPPTGDQGVVEKAGNDNESGGGASEAQQFENLPEDER